MCGISGLLRLDGENAERRHLEGMVESMAHRGPDGRGYHVDGPIALGHLRLSILDPTDAGAQPMHRGSLTLIHNGEVYNYLELANELRSHGEAIETGTDTEVILAAYRTWGLDAIDRFNGMFAFALWDAERHRLVLARDRMGVKPLYIRRTSRTLAFASEVTPFVAARPLDAGDSWVPEPNLRVVHDFLGRGKLDHAAATFIDGVTSVPAAHALVIEDGRERLIRYWAVPELSRDDRPASETTRRSDEGLVEEFRERFEASVRLRLRADVQIGTCLSGGLDSSSIVVTVADLLAARNVGAHEQLPRLAFHARFPSEGIDESRFAEIAAERARMRLVYRSPAGSPILATLLPVLRAQGEPYGSASIHAQYAVMEAARSEDLKVLLDGQGADELLAGYTHYPGVRAAGLLGSGHPIQAMWELQGQVRAGLATPAQAVAGLGRGALAHGTLEAVRRLGGERFGVPLGEPLRHLETLEEPHGLEGTWLARRLWQDVTARGLPALLRYEDRNSMAFGIEARVPFLDVRLVELSARLPDRLRTNRGLTKVVLRRSMAARLPTEIRTRRDKLGFTVPMRTWLEDGLADVASILEGGQLVARGWLDAANVAPVLARGAAGGRPTDDLWRLLITEAWLRLTWSDATASRSRAWDEAQDLRAATPRPRLAGPPQAASVRRGLAPALGAPGILG